MVNSWTELKLLGTILQLCTVYNKILCCLFCGYQFQQWHSIKVYTIQALLTLSKEGFSVTIL